MQLISSRPQGGTPMPLTVIEHPDSPLWTRRTADKSDIKKFLTSIDFADEYIDRPRVIRTMDHANPISLDRRTMDSAGAFLIGELERLDPRIHLPLAAVTWMLDIDLRKDVTIADDLSSYTVSSFAAAQGVSGSNKNWVARRANAIPNMEIDIGKTAQRVEPWSMTLEWTLFELESARRLGRPVDEQKHLGLQRKWNMDVDEQVYMGDSVMGMTGLLNHTLLTNTGNAPTGSWSTATPAQILADVNSIMTSTAGSSGIAVMSNKLLLAFPDLALLATTLISTAGNISVLEFLLRNNITRANGEKLNIQGRKWLLGTGNTFGGFAGKGPTSTNCMVAYRQEEEFVRIPIVPLLRTPIEFSGIYQRIAYYGRIGMVELVYPELVARRSNIN